MCPGAVAGGVVPLGHAAGPVLAARPVYSPAPVGDEAGSQRDPSSELGVHHLHRVDMPLLDLHVPHASYEPVYNTMYSEQNELSGTPSITAFQKDT